jgi:PAS domain S-box-containing protein
VDPETARILDFNTAAHLQLGYSREEFAQLSVFDVEDKETEGETRARLETLAQTGSEDFETVQRTREGELRDIHVKVQAIDIRGRRVYHCVSRDITSRKRMEEELRIHRDSLGELVAERTAALREEVGRRKEKEEQYLSLIQSVKEWIWQTDANFVHTYLSPRIEDVLGYKPEELLGTNPADIMPPEEVERAMPLIRNIINGKKAFQSFDNVAYHKDGRLVFIEANGRPFFDEKGNLLGYRGSCQDITERKEFVDALREREQELESKSRTLEEVNTTLRVLLKQRERDKEELEDQFASNIRTMVLPYIRKIRKDRPNPRHAAYLDVVETNLAEILSPFLNTVKQFDFTPKEAEVVSFIREGKTTKDIARIMGVAKSAVDSHRDNIRKKLGLNNKKANLRTHILSLK